MGLVVGEVVKKIMRHQVEMVDTSGEAVVLIITKPEVEEEARIAVGKTVQVYLVGTYMIINDNGAVQINEWLGCIQNIN